MHDFDRLPPELRRWLAGAALPWSPASALKLWRRALSQTGCPCAACARLDAMQARMLARDAPQIWGKAHPQACTPGPQNAILPNQTKGAPPCPQPRQPPMP